MQDAASADCHTEPATTLPFRTTERLVLVRYLFGVADQQSRQSEPLAGVAVLTLHDGVELFLQLAAEHKNVGPGEKSRTDFEKYFGDIDAALSPDRLSERPAMLRLNKARVVLKHHGLRPAPTEVTRLREAVEQFYEDNTPLVFGVVFGAVSMSDLIRFPGARAGLKEAESKLAEGDTAAALLEIVSSFERAVDDYEGEARAAYGRSPFDFAESFLFDSSFLRYGPSARPPIGPRNQGEFEDKIIRSVESLARGLKLLSLGLDYRQYAKFRLLSPPAGTEPRPAKGGPGANRRPWPPSADDCRFCFDFVVETALRLQNVVFDPV